MFVFSQSTATSFTSQRLGSGTLKPVAIRISVSGSAVGTFDVQGSTDGVTWSSVSSRMVVTGSLAVSGAAELSIESGHPQAYVRVVFTRT
jgi:hypothetical protein